MSGVSANATYTDIHPRTQIDAPTCLSYNSPEQNLPEPIHDRPKRHRAILTAVRHDRPEERVVLVQTIMYRLVGFEVFARLSSAGLELRHFTAENGEDVRFLYMSASPPTWIQLVQQTLKETYFLSMSAQAHLRNRSSGTYYSVVHIEVLR
jgi:hypothetical protein